MPTFAKESALLFVPGADVSVPLASAVDVGEEPGEVCRVEVAVAETAVAVALPSRRRPFVVADGLSALRCWRLGR